MWSFCIWLLLSPPVFAAIFNRQTFCEHSAEWDRRHSNPCREVLAGIVNLDSGEAQSFETKKLDGAGGEPVNMHVEIQKSPLLIVYNLEYVKDVPAGFAESAIDYTWASAPGHGTWRRRDFEKNRCKKILGDRHPMYDAVHDSSTKAILDNGRVCACTKTGYLTGDYSEVKRAHQNCNSWSSVFKAATSVWATRFCPSLVGPFYAAYYLSSWRWEFQIRITLEWQPRVPRPGMEPGATIQRSFELNWTQPQYYDEEFDFTFKMLFSVPQSGSQPPDLSRRYVLLVPRQNVPQDFSKLSDLGKGESLTHEPITELLPMLAEEKKLEEEEKKKEGGGKKSSKDEGEAEEGKDSAQALARSLKRVPHNAPVPTNFTMDHLTRPLRQLNNRRPDTLLVPWEDIDLTGQSCNKVGVSLYHWAREMEELPAIEDPEYPKWMARPEFCVQKTGTCLHHQPMGLLRMDRERIKENISPHYMLTSQSLKGWSPVAPYLLSGTPNLLDQVYVETDSGILQDEEIPMPDLLAWPTDMAHSTQLELILNASEIFQMEIPSRGHIGEIALYTADPGRKMLMTVNIHNEEKEIGRFTLGSSPCTPILADHQMLPQDESIDLTTVGIDDLFDMENIKADAEAAPQFVKIPSKSAGRPPPAELEKSIRKRRLEVEPNHAEVVFTEPNAEEIVNEHRDPERLDRRGIDDGFRIDRHLAKSTAQEELEARMRAFVENDEMEGPLQIAPVSHSLPGGELVPFVLVAERTITWRKTQYQCTVRLHNSKGAIVDERPVLIEFEKQYIQISALATAAPISADVIQVDFTESSGEDFDVDTVPSIWERVKSAVGGLFGWVSVGDGVCHCTWYNAFCNIAHLWSCADRIRETAVLVLFGVIALWIVLFCGPGLVACCFGACGCLGSISRRWIRLFKNMRTASKRSWSWSTTPSTADNTPSKNEAGDRSQPRFACPQQMPVQPPPVSYINHAEMPPSRQWPKQMSVPGPVYGEAMGPQYLPPALLGMSLGLAQAFMRNNGFKGQAQMPIPEQELWTICNRALTQGNGSDVAAALGMGVALPAPPQACNEHGRYDGGYVADCAPQQGDPTSLHQSMGSSRQSLYASAVSQHQHSGRGRSQRGPNWSMNPSAGNPTGPPVQGTLTGRIRGRASALHNDESEDDTRPKRKMERLFCWSPPRVRRNEARNSRSVRTFVDRNRRGTSPFDTHYDPMMAPDISDSPNDSPLMKKYQPPVIDDLGSSRYDRFTGNLSRGPIIVELDDRSQGIVHTRPRRHSATPTVSLCRRHMELRQRQGRPLDR